MDIRAQNIQSSNNILEQNVKITFEAVKHKIQENMRKEKRVALKS